jgi:hypothetical protein
MFVSTAFNLIAQLNENYGSDKANDRAFRKWCEGKGYKFFCIELAKSIGSVDVKIVTYVDKVKEGA